MCGSCAMTVNGRPRWTCRTHVSRVALGGRLEIAPLSNLPVIKDPRHRLTLFFEKWQDARGVFEPSKTRNDRDRAGSPGRAGAHRRRRRHRMHQLRHLPRRLRHGTVERRLSGSGRAQSRVDPGQRSARRRPDGATAGRGFDRRLPQLPLAPVLLRILPQSLSPTASIAALKKLTTRAYLQGKITP